jgi:YD repeat-containing protein
VRIRIHATLAAWVSLAFFMEVAPAAPVLASARDFVSSLRHVDVAVASASPPARIPVKEPVRVKRTFTIQDLRPRIAQAVRPVNPVRLAGPPMLRPRDLDAVIASGRRRSLSPNSAQPSTGRSAEPRTGPGTTASPGTRRAQSLPSNPSASGTGINSWWRYQEQSLPGDGRMMVNVGTGNLLVQQDDMSVAHKGVAMAFRRAYNSQNGGTYAGLYGNGWTNTFDAHLAGSMTGTLSVWDIDGARYDYTYVDGTHWAPPTGQHATLVWDGACGVSWTKKSGTMYYFIVPSAPGATCPYSSTTYGGYGGRLYQIIGRNRNTYISFSYAWDNGDASVNGKISSITATTESGMTATLSFADVSGRRLLQTLTFPDGTTNVQYSYDANGNLVNVSRPANNAAGTRPLLSFGYQQLGADWLLYDYASPRWCQNSTGCGYDGAYLAFGFTGTSAATSQFSVFAYGATVNPTISDGTNTPLYPGYQPPSLNASWLRWEYYTTGVSTPTYRDTDGHMTNWVVDGSGRPTQTQECTASVNQAQQCTGTWLVTNEGWDANNNPVSEVDPRGYETDYAYDANGNAIAVAEPQTTTSQGTFRPTKLFDYDANNNVVAYCDESETHAAGGDWTSAPAVSDSRCSTLAASVPHFTSIYTNPSDEPNGELASMTTPLGYTRHFAYATSQQAGTDYGLPTSVTGDAFTQADGTTITPTQTYWYDGNGLPRCYSNGQGTTVIGVDGLGRTTMVADGDDSSANSGSICGKSGGQPGWNTQTTYVYNPDGSIQSSQGPAQRAVGVSTTFTYDLDGNETSETHHYGCTAGKTCTAGTTNKWYDGADRLVEVGLPHDPSDAYSSTWLTRYQYDLTQSGTVTIAGTSYRAYGGLFKTQEWVPPSGSSSPAWLDLRGSAFDGLDRVVTKYSFSPSSTTALRTTTTTYDASSNTLGLLASATDPLGETTAYTYNELAKPVDVKFSGDGGVTPEKSFVYDANGRVTSATGAAYGTQTNHYDADGRLSEFDEPTSGAVTAPAKLTYDYYPNGQRKDINIASSAMNAAPGFSYSYRVDGKRTRLHQDSGLGDFVMSYTNGGRELSQSDPYTGTTMPSPQSPVPAGSTYGPETRAYDANGQLSTITLPQTFAYQSIVHDGEGAVVGWTGSNSTYGPASMVFQNTVRGENVTQTLANVTPAPYQSSIANGAVVPHVSPLLSKNSPPQTPYSVTIEPINAVIAATSQDQYVASQDPDMPGWVDCGPQVKAQNYDAASRLVSKTTTTNVTSSAAECSGPDSSTSISLAYTYDAENHHTSTGGPFGSTGDPVSWTPDGHAYKIGSNYLHYDGDQLLFITDANGALVESKTEMLANYYPSLGQRILDRGISGQLVSVHNGSFYGGVSLGTTVYRTAGSMNSTVAYIFYGSTNDTTCWQGSSQQAAGCAPNSTFDYSRLEGFDYGHLTFQGARAVDNASGQWTTPDAYLGNVHDPSSQKSFMWDRNNPYSYSDPSGFMVNQVVTADPGGDWVMPKGGGAAGGIDVADAGGQGMSQLNLDMIQAIDSALKELHNKGESAQDIAKTIAAKIEDMNNAMKGKYDTSDPRRNMRYTTTIEKTKGGYNVQVHDATGTARAVLSIHDNSVVLRLYGPAAENSAFRKDIWYDRHIGWPMFRAPWSNGVAMPLNVDNSPGGPAAGVPG